jgi:hypothetical protein
MARNHPDRRTLLQSLRSDYDRAFAQLVEETYRLQNLTADVDPADLLEAEARLAQAQASYRARRDSFACTLLKPGEDAYATVKCDSLAGYDAKRAIDGIARRNVPQGGTGHRGTRPGEHQAGSSCECPIYLG